jgi:hypothetical protein
VASKSSKKPWWKEGLMRTLGLLGLVLLLWGCASHSPVLYPNAHLTRVGEAQAQQDIAECKQLADQYLKEGGAGTVAGSTAVGGGAGAAIGAAGGAVGGSPGTGAAVGAATGATAGFLRGLFKAAEPSPVYKNFVNHCLRERGYEPVGWE